MRSRALGRMLSTQHSCIAGEPDCKASGVHGGCDHVMRPFTRSRPSARFIFLLAHTIASACLSIVRVPMPARHPLT